MKKLSTYALSISLCSLLSLPSALCWADTNGLPEEENKNVADIQIIDPYSLPELPDSIPYRYRLFHGLSVSANLFHPVLELFGKGYRTYEAMITLDLHHRFLPQFAAGVGSCDYTSDDNLCFKSKSTPFFKVGMIYNFNYNDLDGEDFYGAFIRYGMGHTKADLMGITYTDGVWPDYGPVDVYDISYNSHWLEIGGMIKVKVTKHFSAGWDAYWKPLIHKGNSKYGPPYYIPGYGTTSNPLGFGFHIYYDI